jgi:hypothetical protein
MKGNLKKEETIFLNQHISFLFYINHYYLIMVGILFTFTVVVIGVLGKHRKFLK